MTKFYTDDPEFQPEFLLNADYFFNKQEKDDEIDMELLETISDSELVTRSTREEVESKAHQKTMATLDKLQIQMEAMNRGLDDVHDQIEDNADKTLDFLDKLISKDTHLLNKALMPEVTQLDDLIYRMETKLHKATQL